MNATGYQDKPWNEGAYTCAIRQYSSCGRLNGWGGNLDLDKFYGDKDAWNKYAEKGNTTKPEETPKPTVNTPSGSTINLVVGVMRGKYGDGDNRKNALGTTVYGSAELHRPYLFCIRRYTGERSESW